MSEDSRMPAPEPETCAPQASAEGTGASEAAAPQASAAEDSPPPAAAPEALPPDEAPRAPIAPEGAATFALRTGVGVFAGWLAVAISNAVSIAVGLPLPRSGIGLRVLHHLFDFGETAALGVLVGGAMAAWLRRERVPRVVTVLVYVALASFAIHESVQRDLARQALVLLEGKIERPLFWLLVVAAGSGVVTVHSLAEATARTRRIWIVPVVIAVAALVADHILWRDDYPGVHGVVAWGAATLGGVAISERALGVARRVWARARARAAVVAAAAVAVVVALVPPSNAIRVELFREPCGLVAWILADLLWHPPEPSPSAAAAVPPSPWLAPRASLPPIGPTTPPLFDKNPLVVLVTIDATRAEVVDDPANASAMPNFRALHQRGAWFTNATSPGSQTAVSLTSTFSGRYFSQLEWGMHGVGSSRFAYASDDPAPRFPALLSANGVVTASFCSLNFLSDDFGVIRGFSEQKMVAQGRRHAMGKDMVDALLERLRRVDARPTFFYLHLMEPHAPYDRGAVKSGPEKVKYTSEVAAADGLIGRIKKALEAPRFADRAVLVVGSDHGEAFGEHDTYQHTKTLYQELLRVPLLVSGPGVVARRIEQHVGLIDLGPTILDLFGVPTPPEHMGQSLVPLLAGRDVVLDRPLVAEGRLRRAMFLGDIKVIEDTRRELVEVYDLASDPAELDDLWGRDPRADAAFATLRRFFEVHSFSRPGYEPIYKP